MRQYEADAGGLHSLVPDAVSLHQAGRLAEAKILYERILADDPAQFDALHMMGVIALQQGRLEEAQHRLTAALAQEPDNVAAMGNLCAAYLRNRQFQQALEWGHCALKFEPDSSDAQINVGTTLHETGRFAEAIPFFRKVLESSPNSPIASNLLGSCLLKTGDAGAAARAFETATRASPTDADSWVNLSVALNTLGEHERALECANTSLGLRSNSANAFAAHAASLLELGKVDEAIASYREACEHSPSAQILCSFANALLTSGQTEEAQQILRRAIEIDGSNPSARWLRALAAVKPICDTMAEVEAGRHALERAFSELARWQEDAAVSNAYEAVGAAQPFYLAYHETDNVELLRRYGNLCTSWMQTLPAARRLKAPLGRRSGKFRIGIASAHIRDHSVWAAITKGWTTRMNREKFEIFLFSLHPQVDQETHEAERAANFFDGQVKSVADWIDSIQKCNLDALIYPAIGMDALTYQLASLRLAPLQATSWGHPETSGLETIDYYLSGNSFEATDAELNYTERLIRLPVFGTYVEPLDPKTQDPGFDSLNLPKGVPLLLCAGTPFKYTPMGDKVWVDIARGIAPRDGKLVFFAASRGSMYIAVLERIRRAFESAGMVFESHAAVVPVLNRRRFYGLMQRSTLLLDTLGFSGFNTALQSIECGLPVLAYEGRFMRGRLASAIVRNMGMDELVANSPQEFVDKTVGLVLDERRLKKLRSAIPKRRKALFRDDSPIRALEEFLAREISEQRAGQSAHGEAPTFV